jgi:hypothetical protein
MVDTYCWMMSVVAAPARKYRAHRVRQLAKMARLGRLPCHTAAWLAWVQQAVLHGLAKQRDELLVQAGVLEAGAHVLECWQAAQQQGEMVGPGDCMATATTACHRRPGAHLSGNSTTMSNISRMRRVPTVSYT